MGLLRPGLVSHPVDRAVDFGRPLSAEAFRRKIASAARGLAGTGPVAGQYMACRWCCMAAYRGVLAIISGRLAEPDAAADGHRHRGRPSRPGRLPEPLARPTTCGADRQSTRLNYSH